jgi:hypothetical protein
VSAFGGAVECERNPGKSFPQDEIIRLYDILSKSLRLLSSVGIHTTRFAHPVLFPVPGSGNLFLKNLNITIAYCHPCISNFNQGQIMARSALCSTGPKLHRCFRCIPQASTASCEVFSRIITRKKQLYKCRTSARLSRRFHSAKPPYSVCCHFPGPSALARHWTGTQAC